MFINFKVWLKQKLTDIYDKWLLFRARFNRDNIWFKLQTGIDKYEQTQIHAATINYCNAKCVFCGQHSFKRSPGTMDRELFISLAEQARGLGIEEIDFTPPLGDPLLDKDLFDRAAFCKSIGFRKIYITTNGILLEKDWNFKQVAKLFDVIRISIGGLDKESYRAAYQTDKFYTVYAGILLLLEYIGYKYQYAEPKRNVHLFFRSGRKPSDILNSLEFLELKRTDVGQVLTYEFTNFYDNWGGSVRPEDMIGDMRMRKERKKAGVPCQALYHSFVEYQGNVRLCGCRFLDKEDDGLVVGNIKNDTLKNILAPHNVLRIMEKFKKEETLPEVCQGCTLYRPII